MKQDWIPVNSGLYPEEEENVQITYIGYNDGHPYCDAFAYYCEGEWFWSLNDEEVMVEIVAWRQNCDPYIPKL